MQQLQDKELLRSDHRGEPLEDLLQRFTESSDAATDLAGAFLGRPSTAYSAIGHVAYKGTPESRSRRRESELAGSARVIVRGRCGTVAGASAPATAL